MVMAYPKPLKMRKYQHPHSALEFAILVISADAKAILRPFHAIGLPEVVHFPALNDSQCEVGFQFKLSTTSCVRLTGLFDPVPPNLIENCKYRVPLVGTPETEVAVVDLPAPLLN